MRQNKVWFLLCMVAYLAACARGMDRSQSPVTPSDGGGAGATDGDSGSPLELRDSGLADHVADARTTDTLPPARDGSTDSREPECRTNDDCADDRICNGDERCNDGRCIAGAAVDCDDGIACTVDSCSESDGTCTSVPNDALCPDGEGCDPVTGCIAGCLESPCRLVSPQCGCGADKACYLTTAGVRECVDDGFYEEGESCWSPADCEAGLECMAFGSDLSAARCARFCNLDSDCVGSGSLCIGEISDGADGTVRDVKLCTRECDPVWQMGCPPFTSACRVFQEDTGEKRFYTECSAPVGLGWQDDPCASSAECDSGYVCVDPDGDEPTWSARCMRWCDAMTGEGCPYGTVCFAFSDPLVVDRVEYGVCG